MLSTVCFPWQIYEHLSWLNCIAQLRMLAVDLLCRMLKKNPKLTVLYLSNYGLGCYNYTKLRVLSNVQTALAALMHNKWIASYICTFSYHKGLESSAQYNIIYTSAIVSGYHPRTAMVAPALMMATNPMITAPPAIAPPVSAAACVWKGSCYQLKQLQP